VLLIFDIDGTLCDTQEVEGRCYAKAIETVTGKSLATLDWTRYEEPTSTFIVRDLLGSEPAAAKMERGIESEFVRLLREEQPRFPGDFAPISGALEFVSRLRAEGYPIAIATGCFSSSARFKLSCCGLDLATFPHATSSNAPRRRDIIPLAATRAGFTISSVVYFGDAPWDVRVCAHLGIPLIGIGRRHGELRKLGVKHSFRDYTDPDGIISVFTSEPGTPCHFTTF
jgi:phosphoglycolate phosphatase-like HAD superfamily hydrolase